ncbi:hypothetical protein Ga0061067_104156 [Pannonibacter indicus]|jgi:hypothetical protein|uniref:Uncharacterized protein n=1 Tax=Pannonibacter indicus TaxID=466044 RepID=A0A0K6HXZ6_9HYPH|nr:hypothetical protein Ga0061067_104156 [Pannonibacter indicus]
MLVRVALFFTMVMGLAGATAALGLVVTENTTQCQSYKAC